MSGPMFMHVETYATSVSKVRKKREAARAAEGKIVDRKLWRKFAAKLPARPGIVLTIAEDNAANAIIRASEVETKLHLVERELSSKQADAAVYDRIGGELETLLREREREIDALEEARRKREEEEVASRNAKEQVVAELAELRRQHDELNSHKEKVARDKREFEEQRTKSERELAAARAQVALSSRNWMLSSMA